MFFKKNIKVKKDFIEKFPEIIWWEKGDFFTFAEGWKCSGFFICFSSDGFIFYKNYEDSKMIYRKKFNHSFVNESLKERKLSSLCKFAEYDFQFILDKIREEMKQLKEKI